MDDTPIFCRCYCLSEHEWNLVDDGCKELHKVGLIFPSHSIFADATIILTKKDTTGLWMENLSTWGPMHLATTTRTKATMPHTRGDTLLWSRLWYIFTLTYMDASSA